MIQDPHIYRSLWNKQQGKGKNNYYKRGKNKGKDRKSFKN